MYTSGVCENREKTASRMKTNLPFTNTQVEIIITITCKYIMIIR